MTNNERALPQFVTQAAAQREAVAEPDQPEAEQDNAAASSAIAPAEQDRRCFDITCSYLFGDLSLPQAGEELDALALEPLRRKNFGTFVSGLDEAKPRQHGTTSTAATAIATTIPASVTIPTTTTAPGTGSTTTTAPHGP